MSPTIYQVGNAPSGTVNQLTAGSDGVGAAVVSIVSSSHPNEPAGFTELTTHPFTSTLTPTGWTNPGPSADLSLATDATAPKSPSGVGKAHYDAFDGGSFNPVSIHYGFSNKTQVYVHIWHKLSDPYTSHSSGNNKIFFVSCPQEDNVILQHSGTGDGQLHYMVTVQGVPASTNYDGSGATFDRGTWNEVEFLVTADGGGSRTGDIKVWVNGTLTHDLSGITLFDTGSTESFNDFNWTQAAGGGASWPPQDQDSYMDEIYISSN